MREKKDSVLAVWFVRHVVGGAVRLAKLALEVCLKIIGRGP